MVRPYTARAFTYAEKIEMMKQQNDYDTEFVAKHLHGSLSSNQHQATSVNSNDNDNSTASPGWFLVDAKCLKLTSFVLYITVFCQEVI